MTQSPSELNPAWVSALRWVMTQPGLVTGLPGGHEPLLGPTDARLEELLAYTQADPSGFMKILSGRRAHKVGPAFEALVHWGLVQGLGYECLAWDLQVHAQKRTLGAMDLIVRSPQGAVEHWELAYKLYLQADSGLEWSSWVGPNERDRLSLKVSRMLEHQLPLSALPEAREALEGVGVAGVDARRVFLQGALFSPWSSEPCRATGASMLAQGSWARCSEAGAVASGHPQARWGKREKPHWFGPWSNHSRAINSAELLDELERCPPLKPQLWIRHDGGETPFFFLPDSWGTAPS